MILAISASIIVVVVLLWEVGWPVASERLARWRAARTRIEVDGYDPGRERRAEQGARTLLRSCVNEEEWGMYRDLGFIRVWGALAEQYTSHPSWTYQLHTDNLAVLCEADRALALRTQPLPLTGSRGPLAWGPGRAGAR